MEYRFGDDSYDLLMEVMPVDSKKAIFTLLPLMQLRAE